MNKLLYVCLMSICSIGVYACDGCGVCIGNISGDFLNTKSNSFISLSYDYRTYQSSVATDHTIEDVFRTTQINVRKYFFKKVFLEASLPYQSKDRHEDDLNKKLSGFGDLRLGLGIPVLKSWIGTTEVYGQVGVYALLPTASYDADLHDAGLPQNFNLGRGSFAYGGRLSLALKEVDYGVLLNSSFVKSTESPSRYTFGLELSNKITAYKQIDLSNKFKMLLSSGVLHESVSKDRYSNGNAVDASGYNSLYVPLSVGLVFEQFSLIAEILTPIHQDIVNNELESKALVNIQFNYFLNN